MKNPKVVYTIQRPQFENPLEITIDLEKLEEYGLSDYLFQNKLIADYNAEYTVLNRYIILPQKEKESNIKSFSQKQNKKGHMDSKSFPLKKFRVDLHSNRYFREDVNVPQYVDVMAQTKGKALMIAMNKVGYTDFPEGWGDMNVIPGNNVSDWAIYSLGDENNAFLKKRESSDHIH